MTALPTIYITRYDRLIHSDLGEGTCCGIASSAIYNIIHRAFRRCQTRDRRKALCVSGLLTQMCWHTANDAVGRQIDAAWWIILPYGGKSCLRQQYFVTSQENNKKNM